jgi:hypothetical protein
MKYFYNQQFKKHIIQFMEIFRDVAVRTGLNNGTVNELKVPIIYGSMDRVTASLMARNTNNLPNRLPMFSAYLNNISMSPELYKGMGVERKSTHTPVGGVFPNDSRSISQIMPIPYKMSMDLYVYSSNTEQMLQILEQILILFDPQLYIQTSDAPFDGGRLTRVDLTSISNNENFPIGQERRTISYTLSFDIQVYLTIPVKIKDDLIRSIQLRVMEAQGDRLIELIDAETNIDDIIDSALK